MYRHATWKPTSCDFCVAFVTYTSYTTLFMKVSNPFFNLKFNMDLLIFWKMCNALFGTFVKLFAILSERPHKKKSFKFVMDLVKSNLLCCSVKLQILFSGLLFISLYGITYLGISLVFIDRYFFIVHFNDILNKWIVWAKVCKLYKFSLFLRALYHTIKCKTIHYLIARTYIGFTFWYKQIV